VVGVIVAGVVTEGVVGVIVAGMVTEGVVGALMVVAHRVVAVRLGVGERLGEAVEQEQL